MLTTALAITTVLDRVLILPHFHCFRKSTRIFIDCPLNSILKLTSFDRGFANRYRESSFLQNSLVPDAVRNSISQQYFIATPQTNNNTILEFRNHANMTVVVSRNNTISDDQLLQLLGTDQHRVLSLASLEHVHVTFKSDTQQKAFSETVKASFKRAGYRQFWYTWNSAFALPVSGLVSGLLRLCQYCCDAFYVAVIIINCYTLQPGCLFLPVCSTIKQLCLYRMCSFGFRTSWQGRWLSWNCKNCKNLIFKENARRS